MYSRNALRKAMDVVRHSATGTVLSCIVVSALAAQTPDASVRGQVTDAAGRALASANVTATQSETNFLQVTTADSNGAYYFASLPRGVYNLKAELPGFRSVEKQGVELTVGARREENFELGQVAQPGEGPFVIIPAMPSLPVETVASSVSVVVDENRILQLPLSSRNIYSLFLLQPGVTSQGAVGTRGLSFSVHGQRVSGTNYLLDGTDNNNIVLTGPVVATSAEAIQEFRMINSSFSAENGRATAFVAQVGTRSGSNRFHGGLFEFVNTDALNANTSENNSRSVGKPSLHQNQFGYSFAGPLLKNRTFFWSGLEYSNLRFGTLRDFLLPSANFIRNLPPDSLARRLLTEVPPLATSPSVDDPDIGQVRFEAPNRIDTRLLNERLDHQFGNAADRLTFRVTAASTKQQNGEGADFTGYPTLQATDRFAAYNAGSLWTHSFDGSRTNDLRLGWSREHIDQPRPRPDIPLLQSGDGAFLPGSKRQLALSENNNVIQLSDTLSMRFGRSALSMGFQFSRNFSNGVSLGLQNEALGGEVFYPGGLYIFNSLTDFGRDRPSIGGVAVDRFSSGRLQLPDLRRRYRSTEYAAFLQNDVKLSRRFSLNIGLRYEYYGVPHNTDRAQDINFYFGPGLTPFEQVADGVLRRTDQNPGDLKNLLYRRDRLNFAPSIGLAWAPLGTGAMVVRAGYALAFDRVFDTVRDLRSNQIQSSLCLSDCPFAVPIEGLLPRLIQMPPPTSAIQLDENLRTPYAQNWYFGIQKPLQSNLLLEVGHAGSVGRKLISRDLTNRAVPTPLITFLSNAGNSNYLALEAGLRRSFGHGLQYQVSYTYSHAIDNQSDIFEGVRTGASALPVLASFTREFDARTDRGSANFDQRHNLVLNAIWEVPGIRAQTPWVQQLLTGWSISVIGAHRTGFPVTVIGSADLNYDSGLYANRADFSGSRAQLSSRRPVAGGVQWLDPTLFSAAGDHVGNLGRGSIAGPGSWNYDAALLRNVTLSETARLQFRTEFYNVFNHANLSNPVSVLDNPNFGRSYYGGNRGFSRFGDLPLENPSRRIQFGLRIEF